MTVIRTCWYLCAMCLLMLPVVSAITVAPSGERFAAGLMATLIGLAITSGLVALLFSRQIRKTPEWFVFRSRAVSRICVGIAALLTLIFLFGIVG